MKEKTLFELKNEVGTLEKGMKKPSARELRTFPVYVQKCLTDASLSVYENGFCLYVAKGRSTVFHLEDCKGYSFSFAAGSEDLSDDYFQEQEWFVLPLLIGEDLLSRNQEHRLSNHGVFSYSDIAEDYMDMKDPNHFLEKLFQEETIQEVFRLLDKRQCIALKAYYYEGLSQKQISDRLQIPQQNVSYLLKSTIKKLRTHFGCAESEITRIRNNNISENFV